MFVDSSLNDMERNGVHKKNERLLKKGMITKGEKRVLNSTYSEKRFKWIKENDLFERLSMI